MVNKYYGLGIGDLRIGLLYERLNGSVWEMKQIRKEDMVVVGCHSIISELIHEIVVNESKGLRIKGLNGEDIETYGFKKWEVNGVSYDMYVSGKYVIEFDNRNMNIMIKRGDDILFNGVIMSSQRLADVLLMVGYYDNSKMVNSLYYGL